MDDDLHRLQVNLIIKRTTRQEAADKVDTQKLLVQSG
jgi:hypothetical protein